MRVAAGGDQARGGDFFHVIRATESAALPIFFRPASGGYFDGFRVKITCL